jgi:phospholipid/cholesterol/gamma-HCH transport system substrate-binding protein
MGGVKMFDIKKQLLWSKLKVGIVITLALLILFLTVFFAGSIERILSPKVEIRAQIQNVKGLRKGAPVWISGIEVGSVKNMNLNPEYGTIVTLSINKNALKYLRKDAEASILTMGLLGDKYVELSNGSPEAGPIKPGDMIKGTAQIELQDVVETSAASIEKVSDFLNKLENLVTRIEKGEGTIAKFLTDPSVYNNLQETTKSLSAILKDLQSGHGTLKMLLEDPSLYNKLVSTTSALEELSKKLNESSGTMKKLIEDPSLYNRMLATASSMDEFSRKLNEGQGTLRRLAEEPDLYENLNKASKQLSSLLEKMETGQGVAGDLITDKKLANDLKDTIVELKELTKDIRENPRKYFKFSLF